MGFDPFIVITEGSQATRNRGIGYDIHQVRAVWEVTHHFRIEETGSGITGLRPENAVQFDGMADGFMYLKGKLGALQDDAWRFRRAGLGGKKLRGFLRYSFSMVLNS